MSGCLAENDLLDLLEGQLSEDESARRHDHISGCPVCFSLLAALGGALPGAGPTDPAALAETDPDAMPQPGDAWLPPPQIEEFRLLRPLGRGAMGQVYAAHDTLLDRLVAIKFLAAQAPDDLARERFWVEARAIARLTHPNVVGIYRVGEVAGHPYLASEFVHGTSLDRLARPVPWERALSIGIGLCRGLGAAHWRGVLHRDIKPANAILADGGEVKLLDFGLAKLGGPLPEAVRRAGEAGEAQRALPPLNDLEAIASPSLTGAGALVGTPLYLAPELWRGEAATVRSDLYALGVVLYELCTGRTPHTGATLKDLARVVQSEAPPPLDAVPGIDPRFARLVQRCLLRDPAARWGSCEELDHALEVLRLPAGAQATPAGNPYRGLSVFEAEHRGLFFGRGLEARALVERLRADPLVVCAGDSGVGKSSLCRAGVLPLIAEGALGEGRRWSCVTLLPGRHPFRALATALGGDRPLDLSQDEPSLIGPLLLRRLGAEQGLLIFIDQAEELLTQGEPAETRLCAEALGQLCGRLPGVRLLLTVRGDFLTRLTDLPGLGPEISRAIYLLRSLGEAELREAIVGPARALGVSFESAALIDELMASAAVADGGLPLLQFALAELWEARDAAGKVIPAAALAALGGVTGALSRHADTVVNSLLPQQRQAARRVLGQLVTAHGTRARCGETDLLSGDPSARAALDALVRGRLVVARESEREGSIYEVAHEALIQGWASLREWLAEDVEQRAVRERLIAAAAEWDRLGQARDALWGRAPLDELQRVALSPEDLGERERLFLAASRRERTRRTRSRQGVRAVLLGLPLLLGLVGYLWWRSANLEEQRRAAHVAALARLPGREIEALREGVRLYGEATRRGRRPSAPALEALGAALTVGGPALPPLPHGDAVWVASYSPDGDRIATGSADRVAHLWDGRTGQPLAALRGHGAEIGALAFSPDGARLCTGSEDGGVRLWDARDGRALGDAVRYGGQINDVAFSPDGAKVAVGAGDGQVYVLDGRTGAPLAALSGHRGPVFEVRFSPRGDWLASAGGDHTVRLWTDAPGDRPRAPARVLSDHGDEVRSARFSPDGTALLTAGKDRTARLWDVRTGQARLVLRGHAGPLRTASFSPDGQTVLTASEDGTARLWDSATGATLAILRGHTSGVNAAAFSPDGMRIATAGLDHAVRLWAAATGTALGTLQGHQDRVWAVSFSPDGSRVLSAGQDHTARIWDAQAGQTVLHLGPGEIHAGAVSPDGALAVTGSEDGIGRIWDLRGGRLRTTLTGHTGPVLRVAFSPDGGLVATASWDGTARIWETGGRPLHELRGHGRQVAGVAFSPDGRLLATGGYDGKARIWEVTSGAPVRSIEAHQAVPGVAFSPDGRRLATAGEARTAQVWDLASGAALLTLQGHTDSLWAVAFSPDGTRLCTTSIDGTARVWDARTGQELLALLGHRDITLGVAFSPDGRRIATASNDGTGRLWDAASGAALGVLPGHVGAVRSVAFLPGGAQVVTFGRDQEVKIHPATVEALFQRACDRLRSWPQAGDVKGLCR